MIGARRSWRSCRRRLKSWKRRRRRSAARLGPPSSCCSARRWSGPGGGTIDIVASATGKIVPSGRTKVIQPFETGVVRSIRVQDGQAVKAGDVLIELDPTVNAAERDRLQNDLLAEQLNIARLHAAFACSDDALADFNPPADTRPPLG